MLRIRHAAGAHDNTSVMFKGPQSNNAAYVSSTLRLSVACAATNSTQSRRQLSAISDLCLSRCMCALPAADSKWHQSRCENMQICFLGTYMNLILHFKTNLIPHMKRSHKNLIHHLICCCKSDWLARKSCHRCPRQTIIATWGGECLVKRHGGVGMRCYSCARRSTGVGPERAATFTSPRSTPRCVKNAHKRYGNAL
jgi:hypothetical protein